ncbi:MAG: type II toxin-antitoxin system HicB family antitoxin [Caldilinea sp. CFX5]|nr:type II toxin-antitoxin system HicB family antitoxin [Caldilinea sp. CFX5]
MSQTNQNNTGTLKYDVMIEQTNGKGYTARLLAWPETVVEAPTRERALQQMRVLLLERLAKVEIVTLEIQPNEIGHSWAPFAGDWADNPYIEEFRAEIERYRREVDAIHAPWLLEEETTEQPSQVEGEVVHVVLA